MARQDPVGAPLERRQVQRPFEPRSNGEVVDGRSRIEQLEAQGGGAVPEPEPVAEEAAPDEPVAAADTEARADAEAPTDAEAAADAEGGADAEARADSEAEAESAQGNDGAETPDSDREHQEDDDGGS